MRKTKIFFGILFIVGVFGVLIFLTPSAKATLNTSATASLTVTNSAPVVSSQAITGGNTVTLTAGDVHTVTATFTVTDNNGCQDIDILTPTTVTTAKLFGGAATSACTPSSSTRENCYAMSCTQDALSCTAGGADLDATYTCTADVYYYADPSDGGTYNGVTWTLDVTPADNAGAASSNTTKNNIAVQTLTAVDVTQTAISYGAMALGGNTDTQTPKDQTTEVKNKGNRTIDAEVKAYGANSGDTTHSMTCTVGSLLMSGNYEGYTLVSNSTVFASLTPITGSYVQLTGFNTAPTTDGSTSSKNIYWGMALPSTGVGGSCSGTVAFTAVTH